MKILVAEDDYASRSAIVNFLNQFGECDATVDGNEAVAAFEMAVEEGEGYDLVCLDAQMPFKNGIEVYEHIRRLEKENGVSVDKCAKVIMTTALNQHMSDDKKLSGALYCTKPINYDVLRSMLEKAGLI